MQQCLMQSSYTDQDHNDSKCSLNKLWDNITERLQLMLNEQYDFDNSKKEADSTEALDWISKTTQPSLDSGQGSAEIDEEMLMNRIREIYEWPHF